MPLTPQGFVSKWKRVNAREKQTYQEHFISLCHLVGHQTPNDYNPTRTNTLTLDDLLKPESLKTIQTVFFQPEQLKPQITVEGVTREAAKNLRKYSSASQKPPHKKLDQAVFAAYGWNPDLTDEESLEKLLALNLERRQ